MFGARVSSPVYTPMLRDGDDDFGAFGACGIMMRRYSCHWCLTHSRLIRDAAYVAVWKIVIVMDVYTMLNLLDDGDDAATRILFNAAFTCAIVGFAAFVIARMLHALARVADSPWLHAAKATFTPLLWTFTTTGAIAGAAFSSCIAHPHFTPPGHTNGRRLRRTAMLTALLQLVAAVSFTANYTRRQDCD